jgi:hypothetical protein
MRRWRLLVAILGGMLVGACSSEDLPTVVTVKPASAHADVGLAGTLLEHQGCVMLKREGPGDNYVLLLFPSGTSAKRVDGDVVVETPGGSATLGDQVLLAGGTLTRDGASRLVEGELPSACITELMFDVGEFD